MMIYKLVACTVLYINVEEEEEWGRHCIVCDVAEPSRPFTMTSFDVSAAAAVPVWQPPIEALRWVLVLVAVRVPVVSVLWGLTVAVVRGSNEPEPEIRDFCCIVAFTLTSCPILIRCSVQLKHFEFWKLNLTVLLYENSISHFWQQISPRFPWRVKRTTVICICQDELPAAVLCGILSEGGQGLLKRRMVSADLYLWE